MSRRERANRMLANVELELQHAMRDPRASTYDVISLLGLHLDVEDMFFDACSDIIDLERARRTS